MNYPIVLFDLDHTLLDSNASEQAAFALTMQSVGVAPTDETFEVYDGINQALWRQVEAGEITPHDVKVRRFERLLDRLGAQGDPIEMGATFVRGLTDHGDLYPGVGGLLDSIAGRSRLGLVTNGIGPVQRGRLDRLDIARYFEVVSVSGELAMSKPARAIFDHTLAELGVTDRADVVMIGDSLSSDIAGGANAGIDTIWFNQHGAPQGASVPTHEAGSLAAIADLLVS
ncbi:MAG: YjjG family noncanonical pyrimidine nucleotidase [Ilumatobacter sp.]|uniref:YjjG family noncanonical pyrimidine nucleotidase n=1 Tax=Ilumatobacter sp. TaxID=1967498 RepID=UPI003C77D025